MYFLSHLTLEPTSRLLNEALAGSVAAVIGCPSAASERHRCDRQDSIQQWLARPQRYDGDGIHALYFGKHVSATMGMNRELVRLCQALRKEVEHIRQLNDQYEHLSALLAAVKRSRGR